MKSPVFYSIIAVGIVIGTVVPVKSVRAETQQDCVAKYNANKLKIAAEGQTQQDFLASCLAAATDQPVPGSGAGQVTQNRRMIPAGGIISTNK